jgi:hypothetical protein
MTKERTLFVLLPYLKTSDRVVIRGIEFRSSADMEGLAADTASHLQILSRLFLQRGQSAIENMVCATVSLPADRKKASEVLSRVSEAQLLLAYLYTGPHPGGGSSLSSELATVFAVEPDSVPSILVWGVRTADRADMIPGYSGTRNLHLQAYFTEESRIPPDPPWMTQNYFQDLRHDIEEFLNNRRNWALAVLFDPLSPCGPETVARAFLGLNWYSRSCRESASPEEAIVALSIAFESLFRLSSDRLTERFKEAVLTLLGPVERLDSWIEQFYDARSKTVHEGQPPELYFYVRPKSSRRGAKGPEEGLALRPLWEYGLRVFRLCLNTLLAGATAAKDAGLEESFVHNQERLERICRHLDGAGTARDRLAAAGLLAEGLMNNRAGFFDPGVGLDTLFGAASRLLMAYQETSPQMSPGGEAALREAVERPEQDAPKRLDQFQRLASQLAKESSPMDPTTWAAREAVAKFLSYATGHGFWLQILLRKRATES